MPVFLVFDKDMSTFQMEFPTSDWEQSSGVFSNTL